MSTLLVLLIALPMAGSLLCAAMPATLAKGWAMLVSLATLAISIVLLCGFNFHQNLSLIPAAQQVARSVQIQIGAAATNPFAVPSMGFSFHLGVDAISILLVALTTFLMPLALAASFGNIKQRQTEHYAWLLLLLAAMNGVFLSRDLLLFYIFFELTLVPMFFIIGIWGGPERRYAAGKFFLFTFAGSVFLLAAAVFLGTKYGTFDISTLIQYAQRGGPNGIPALTSLERKWVLVGLLAGFAVKVPLFPLHTWLPLAHVEAPTAGVVLSGHLLKLGAYGVLRLALPLGMIDASGIIAVHAARAVAVLCIIGILYSALVAWVQKDIKKLVAYSSISHMGFCVLGLVALNDIGMQGSVLYMINHSLSTGALFLCIGMIYERFHTRDIDQLSGLARIMPRLAFFFVLFAMSSIGLPGTNGFVSEFLTVLGAYVSSTLGKGFGSVAALGVVLGAVYMLHMLARVLFGPLKFPDVHTDPHNEPRGHAFPDVQQSGHLSKPAAALADRRDRLGGNDIGAPEMAILIPLAIVIVLIGVVPSSLLRPIKGDVELLRAPVAAATHEVTDSGVAEDAGNMDRLSLSTRRDLSFINEH